MYCSDSDMEIRNFFQLAWINIMRATVDKKSDFKNVVVTSYSDNFPNSRIMILRNADPYNKSFTFFTDCKSKKFNIIDKHPNGCLLFWDQSKRLQVCTKGKFKFCKNTSNLWNSIGEVSKKQYGSIPYPHTIIPNSYNFKSHVDKTRFTVLKFEAINFDILQLSKISNKRAIFEQEQNWLGQWVVP
tara:strand:- start:264 stop:821 length:558 start_codon:yes stop_codon:yes gene_type:complete